MEFEFRWGGENPKYGKGISVCILYSSCFANRCFVFASVWSKVSFFMLKRYWDWKCVVQVPFLYVETSIFFMLGLTAKYRFLCLVWSLCCLLHT